MKRLFLIASSVPFLTCIPAQSAPTATDDKAVQESKEAAPDNTKKNVRDPQNPKVTAENQSNEQSDVDITTKLRKEIMDQKGFSTNAQNVKIVTENGLLTLRGPVDNQKEKDVIGSLAEKCSGAAKISNQLEVKAPQ